MDNGAASQDPSFDTIIGRLVDIRDRAQSLRDRTSGVSNRLLTDPPTPQPGIAAISAPAGNVAILSTLLDLTYSIARAQDETFASLNSIDRKLGGMGTAGATGSVLGR